MTTFNFGPSKGGRPMLPFKRILCPIDFSEHSYKALHAANELALNFSAQLYIVHVVSPVPVVQAPAAPSAFNLASYQQELMESSEKSLREMTKERMAGELEARPIIAYGDAASEIVRIADEKKIDLIVIATHGKTGFQHLFFGSVAEKVVRLSPCPVLTIRAAKQVGQ
jgi:nucleotide-binding universal stress UspA family protein